MKAAKYVIAVMVLVLGMGLLNGAEARIRYVKKTPPARKVVVVHKKNPYKNGVWVQGHWAWKSGVYSWVDGKWIKPKKGHKWVDGHWKKTRNGWVWVEGHWRKR